MSLFSLWPELKLDVNLMVWPKQIQSYSRYIKYRVDYVVISLRCYYRPSPKEQVVDLPSKIKVQTVRVCVLFMPRILHQLQQMLGFSITATSLETNDVSEIFVMHGYGSHKQK